jgi:hypothetical protein
MGWSVLGSYRMLMGSRNGQDLTLRMGKEGVGTRTGLGCAIINGNIVSATSSTYTVRTWKLSKMIIIRLLVLSRLEGSTPLVSNSQRVMWARSLHSGKCPPPHHQNSRRSQPRPNLATLPITINIKIDSWDQTRSSIHLYRYCGLPSPAGVS